MIKLGRAFSSGLARLPRAGFSKLSDNFGQIFKRDGQSEIKDKEFFRYVEGQLVPISNIVLRQQDNIEQYVMKVVKDYHRTTYRAGLTLESNLADHGLDSLDAIELAMQLEEDLGYRISAENLSVFHKVKHFVNFIEQVENFKKTYNKDPLP